MPLTGEAKTKWMRNYRLALYANDPEYRKKAKCRAIAGHATRDGRLKKGPCEKCGQASVEAHHDDYSKPLSVRWLCRLHHEEIHGGAGCGGGPKRKTLPTLTVGA